jgi:two-component system chemotaxis sensor kinase CheA
VTTAPESATRQGGLANRRTKENLYLVVVGMGEDQVGLVVDSLIGEQEVVIKGLGKFIGDIKGISGATILGDGRVALIVDINGIIGIAMEEKGAVYAA